MPAYAASILVIDDEPDLRTLYELTLLREGYRVEAAANLFDALHRADAAGRPIAIAPIPDHGMGRAINDRLRRAAAPR